MRLYFAILQRSVNQDPSTKFYSLTFFEFTFCIRATARLIVAMLFEVEFFLTFLNNKSRTEYLMFSEWFSMVLKFLITSEINFLESRKVMSWLANYSGRSPKLILVCLSHYKYKLMSWCINKGWTYLITSSTELSFSYWTTSRVNSLHSLCSNKEKILLAFSANLYSRRGFVC